MKIGSYRQKCQGSSPRLIQHLVQQQKVQVDRQAQYMFEQILHGTPQVGFAPSGESKTIGISHQRRRSQSGSILLSAYQMSQVALPDSSERATLKLAGLGEKSIDLYL